ncbi:MAG: hypothetical protein ACI9QN_000009 [Arcticibacterium sp.]|jgi:hypothetical protein
MIRQNLKELFILALIAEGLILAYAYFSNPFETGETFRLAARYSGRLSLFFILATFILTTLNWSDLRGRFKEKFIGLIALFSVLHAIHFVFLALSLYLNHIELVPFKLLGGTLGYLTLLIYPWVLKAKKPPFWMDYFYFYYLLIIIMVSILSRLSGAFEGVEPSVLHYVGLIITGAMLLFHFSRIYRNA